eukprot:12449703-Prorocentrum_lima.AAC.1
MDVVTDLDLNQELDQLTRTQSRLLGASACSDHILSGCGPKTRCYGRSAGQLTRNGRDHC